MSLHEGQPDPSELAFDEIVAAAQKLNEKPEAYLGAKQMPEDVVQFADDVVRSVKKMHDALPGQKKQAQGLGGRLFYEKLKEVLLQDPKSLLQLAEAAKNGNIAAVELFSKQATRTAAESARDIRESREPSVLPRSISNVVTGTRVRAFHEQMAEGAPVNAEGEALWAHQVGERRSHEEPLARNHPEKTARIQRRQGSSTPKKGVVIRRKTSDNGKSEASEA